VLQHLALALDTEYGSGPFLAAPERMLQAA
jgi:hypothetical protein